MLNWLFKALLDDLSRQNEYTTILSDANYGVKDITEMEGRITQKQAERLQYSIQLMQKELEELASPQKADLELQEEFVLRHQE